VDESDAIVVYFGGQLIGTSRIEDGERFEELKTLLTEVPKWNLQGK